MNPRRGELWRARFPPLGSTSGHQRGATLVAVVQHNRRRYGKTILCVPLTTNRARERPYGVLIQHDGRNNLAEDSVAMPWLALAVDVMNLRRRTGRLEAVDTERIAEMVISLISE